METVGLVGACFALIVQKQRQIAMADFVPPTRETYLQRLVLVHQQRRQMETTGLVGVRSPAMADAGSPAMKTVGVVGAFLLQWLVLVHQQRRQLRWRVFFHQ